MTRLNANTSIGPRLGPQSEIDADIARLAALAPPAATDPAAAGARWASFVAPAPGRLGGLGRQTIGAEHGVQSVGSLDELLALARRGATAGSSGVQTVKFLMVDAQEADRQLHLINGATHPYHYYFYKGAGLGDVSNAQFNRDTYVFFDRDPPPARKNIAGTLFYYPNHKDDAGNSQPLLTFGFWPTDHIQADEINKISAALAESVDAPGVDLAYVPAGETHERLLARYENELGDITIKRTDELYKNVDFRAMNEGISYGYLTDRPLDSLGPRDIAIFARNAPNDGLPHLRGFITGEQQGDGSHIQLLSEQDGIPNAMIKDPLNNADLQPFINADRPVRFEVTPDGFSVREASQTEVEEHFDAIRPLEPVSLERNLNKRDVRSFKDPNFGLKDADAYGGKSAALAELWNVRGLDSIANVKRMDGYGLPFYFYQEFMTKAVVPGDGRTFEDYAIAMLADPDFQADPNVRRERLAQFQEWMVETPLPDHLHAEIDAVWDKRAEFARDPNADPSDVNVRARSTGAGEDSSGWSGAGIYTSYTNNQREDLKDTVRQTWSSWWNFEAIEERGFYKFEHISGAMGVGFHQNFPDRDEVATGVAFTKSDAFPGWGGHYVHAQVGGGSVTNPAQGEQHDSFLMADLTGDGQLELLYSQRSNQTSDGAPVLSKKMITALNESLTVIHDHWAKLLDRVGDDSFGVDVEYKVVGEGDNETLYIKQVRPLVPAPVNHTEQAREALAAFATEISGGAPINQDHATALIDRIRHDFASMSRPFPRKAANPKTLRFGVASALRDLETDATAATTLEHLVTALPKFTEGATLQPGQTPDAILDSAGFQGLDGDALTRIAERALARDANFGRLESFELKSYQPVVAEHPGRITFAATSRGRSYERTYQVDSRGAFAPL